MPQGSTKKVKKVRSEPLEREIEAKCRTIAKSNNCYFLKMEQGGGVPDRLVVLPNGLCWFVEFKRSEKHKRTQKQLIWAKNLKDHNQLYSVIYDPKIFTIQLEKLLTE